MADLHSVEFPESRLPAPPDATRLGPVPPAMAVEVSVYLKPRAGDAAAIAGAADARAALARHRRAGHDDDIRRIERFARDHGLAVVASEPARRLVKLQGSAAACEAAFGTELALYRQGERQFRARSGCLRLPADLLAIVQAVLGLDERPAAFAKALAPHDVAGLAGHRPHEVAALYGFPTGVTGAGQCIAIIELGGGYRDSDVGSAFAAMGLAAPTVVAVPVDGVGNAPGPSLAADQEVALDLQVAGGVAPGARLAIYFAPASFMGFVDAVGTAIHDPVNRPTIVSISWGTNEERWSAAARQAMDAAFEDAITLGLSVFTAAGDHLATNGAADGQLHVQYPASSPWAISCGGTAILADGGRITAETVWSDAGNGEGTGGGISRLYPVPPFQAAVALPAHAETGQAGRGVPDVAGNAAEPSGYLITLNGAVKTIGGTSAVAPLWAGLAALVNERAAKPLGFFLPILYAEPGLLRAVTEGDNRPKGTAKGYAAGPGWNPCTGLGVPQGQALFERFAAT